MNSELKRKIKRWVLDGMILFSFTLFIILSFAPASVTNEINSNPFALPNYLKTTYVYETAVGGVEYNPVHTLERAPPNRVNQVNATRTNDGILIRGKNIYIGGGRGTSMIPTLPTDGHQTLVIPVSKLEVGLSVGDIVGYKPGNESPGHIVHRIVWKNETHFIARGDNNPVNDSMRPLSSITHVIVGIIY